MYHAIRQPVVSTLLVALEVIYVLWKVTASVMRATCIEALVRTPAGRLKHAVQAAEVVCTSLPSIFAVLMSFSPPNSCPGFLQ